MASSVSEKSYDDERRISSTSAVGGADSGVSGLSDIPQEEAASMKSNKTMNPSKEAHQDSLMSEDNVYSRQACSEALEIKFD